MVTPSFDAQASIDLKDQALQQVLDNAGSNFIEQAAAIVPILFAGQTVLAEDWRLVLSQLGIKPHHPNAWGGLTKSLATRQVISPTDRLAKSKDKHSHARRQPLWLVSSPIAPTPTQQ